MPTDLQIDPVKEGKREEMGSTWNSINVATILYLMESKCGQRRTTQSIKPSLCLLSSCDSPLTRPLTGCSLNAFSSKLDCQ